MNREIKFRAWFENKMYQVTSISLDNQYYSWSHDDEGPVPLGTEVTLMQYTGLVDRNGKEIYEGDILLSKDKSWTCAIVWSGRLASWGLSEKTKDTKWTSYLKTDSNKGSEIIGNIYESPNKLNT